jgi:glycosyltransferase involved in cell wall biosynthesis
MESIIVNASSLRTGGALTILRQFVHFLESSNKYVIFINEDVILNTNKSNVEFVRVTRQSAIKRVFWDFLGLFLYTKFNRIACDKLISLQNTSVFFPFKPQIIYVHNGLFLHPMKWSFFRKKERVYAFYKYVYPIFIFAFSWRRAQFVVQTEWMKNALVNQFSRNENTVYVIKPDLVKINVDSIPDKKVIGGLSCFYPASSESFKNHKLLIDALIYLKRSDSLSDEIIIYLTINKTDIPELFDLITTNGIQNNVCFLGQIQYSEVLSFYKSCSRVLFPSLIESFGLPMLEAAKFGKPIACLPTGFGKEVLMNYEGAHFLSDSPSEWANYLLSNEVNLYRPFQPEFETNWTSFFDLVCEENKEVTDVYK